MHKNKLKLDLNVRSKTIKLLEENIGSTLFGADLSNSFLDIYSQAREIKSTKILKKTKKLSYSEETINKTKGCLLHERFLQMIYAIRGSYPKYTGNSYNSTSK